MIVGIPRETHHHEHRVGLTPYAVRFLVERGHTVVVEQHAGDAARFPDDEYRAAGAQVAYNPEEPYKRADIVCRVGVVSPDELDLLRAGSTVCGFQHLAVQPRATIDRLRELEITAIGYELIENGEGQRPVLVPFSEMAGQMAIYIASHLLENGQGGRGILLGTAPGIAPPTVLILGAGTVGRTAARRAVAVGAHVIVLDEDLNKLRAVSRELAGQVVTQLADAERLAQFTAIADVVIGAVLIPGARAPFLVTEDMVKRMRPGSVILDLSIDQGGCVETSRPTTPEQPTFIVHQVVHYCVPNMTANVARTASRALADAVRHWIAEIARQGPAEALRRDPGLASGVYLYAGTVVNPGLGAALGLPTRPLADLLGEAGESTP